MANLALSLDEKKRLPQQDNVICLIKGRDGENAVFCRGHLFSSYDRSDLYARNYLLVQLFLHHKISQKILSETFGLTVPHISALVGRYRREGSAGIENHTVVRLKNNQKIKGKIANYLIIQLEKNEADRPTYNALAMSVKRKFKVSLSADRVGNWWRIHKKK